MENCKGDDGNGGEILWWESVVGSFDLVWEVREGSLGSGFLS